MKVHLIHLYLAIGLFVIPLVPAVARADDYADNCSVDCMDELVRMSACELDAIYMSACPGQLPHGFVPGRAIFFAGSRLAVPMSKCTQHLWQGKVFDGCIDRLTNKIAGVEAVPAQIYCGASWLDGKPAWILDYRGTSKIARRTRDEIREIAPGLYLGIMFRDLGCRQQKFCYFTLDARKPCMCQHETAP